MAPGQVGPLISDIHNDGKAHLLNLLPERHFHRFGSAFVALFAHQQAVVGYLSFDQISYRVGAQAFSAPRHEKDCKAVLPCPGKKLGGLGEQRSLRFFDPGFECRPAEFGVRNKVRAVVDKGFVQVADHCRYAFGTAGLLVFQELFAGAVSVINGLLGLLSVLGSLAEVDAYLAAEILLTEGRRFDVDRGQAVNRLDGQAEQDKSRKQRGSGWKEQDASPGKGSNMARNPNDCSFVFDCQAYSTRLCAAHADAASHCVGRVTDAGLFLGR